MAIHQHLFLFRENTSVPRKKFLVVTARAEHVCDVCKTKIKKGQKCGMRVTRVDDRIKFLKKDFVHTKHLTYSNVLLKAIDLNNAKSFFKK